MGIAEKKQQKKDEKSNENILILYNDEVNTFEHVIETLKDVCNHTIIQAEQCAHIVHYNGSCEVKFGDFESISEMNKILISKGLKSEIQ